jgi:hypothetical protein
MTEMLARWWFAALLGRFRYRGQRFFVGGGDVGREAEAGGAGTGA